VPNLPAADLSNLHVVLPVRGTDDAKERLALALDAEERGALVMGLVLHVLDTLATWPDCRQVHVVSPDPLVRETATARGLQALADEATDLNAALRSGREAAVDAGATAVLYLPVDLPLLAHDSLDRLHDAADAALAAGAGRQIVVIAPSDARGGTNALLVSPPAAVEPSFGEASFEAHLRGAAAADATVQLVHDPTLGFDLDTPDDLERLDADRMVALLDSGAEALAALEPFQPA
jgi:2-phospho-L-lactate/phosphoenolpyruvate guanylyltransferase